MKRLPRLVALVLLVGGVSANLAGQGRPAVARLVANGSDAPQRPTAYVDTAAGRQAGRTISVPKGGDFQSALSTAHPGDTIALEAGAVFEGPFTLPAKAGPGTILITTSTPQTDLPAPGTRIHPSYLASLATLTGSGPGPVLLIPSGVGGYRLVGLEIRPSPGRFLLNLVLIGDPSDKRPTPGSIVFDRCYLHGDPTRGGRRGIAMNGGETAVINSYLSDFKEVGADSQAIAGWNGAGPFAILNNYLEAAGENVLFGGADPSTPELVPADIEIRRNHFTKPLSWKADEPVFAGTAWTVKNLLELKNARRVLIDGNILEYVWPAAQNGFAVVFTVRNQDGRSPWSTVEDVTFSNNIVRHAAGGINMLGQDDLHTSGPTRRVLVRNNLFDDIGGVWGNGRLFQLLNGTSDVVFDHNTADTKTDSILQGGDTTPHRHFGFYNNIVPHNLYGVIGSGAAPGRASLERYFPGISFTRNIIVGGGDDKYPAGNFFPASSADVGFTDTAKRDYRLGPDSRFLGAGTDGTDPGVNMATLLNATAGVDVAKPRPQPTAPFQAGVFPTLPLASAQGISLGVVFWVSVAFLIYTYAGYPLMIAAWGRLHPHVGSRRRIEPTVTVLVIAHNEGSAIVGRIANLLALDYPPERLAIVIASDGSTDDTVAAARAAGGSRVQVMPFQKRRGKAAVINELVPTLDSEITVLADTRQRIEPGAMCALVAPFADPHVGAVSGELMLEAAPGRGTAGRGIGFYWRYEKFIRQAESTVDSTIGATGAVYALRTSLFEVIPPDTILDDVVIPMRIARRGFRVLFEPGARAFDCSAATTEGELARKVRTSAGNFQLLATEPWLLHPLRNRLWLQTMSHKAFRLLLPVLHLAALAASVALAWLSSLYMYVAVLQVCFYALAIAGAIAQAQGNRLGRLLSVPYVICLLLWATVAGLLKFMRGLQSAAWEPTHGVPVLTNYWLPDTTTSSNVPDAVENAVSTSNG